MRYLCLGYYDEDAFDRLSPAELEELVAECGAHDAALRESGHLVSVASLAHRSARSLRPDGGATSVTDGPFAETKEIVGSFFTSSLRTWTGRYGSRPWTPPLASVNGSDGASRSDRPIRTRPSEEAR
jgi:hypothetical protein